MKIHDLNIDPDYVGTNPYSAIFLSIQAETHEEALLLQEFGYIRRGFVTKDIHKYLVVHVENRPYGGGINPEWTRALELLGNLTEEDLEKIVAQRKQYSYRVKALKERIIHDKNCSLESHVWAKDLAKRIIDTNLDVKVENGSIQISIPEKMRKEMLS